MEDTKTGRLSLPETGCTWTAELRDSPPNPYDLKKNFAEPGWAIGGVVHGSRRICGLASAGVFVSAG
jgi:hypothetical protein